MITTSRKNLTLGATVCTLALVAGYVWICRGEQPRPKQFTQGEVQKTHVRAGDSTPKGGKQIARPARNESEEESTSLTMTNSTKREPVIKIDRGRENANSKRKTRVPAC